MQFTAILARECEMSSEYRDPEVRSGTLAELLRHPTKKREEAVDQLAFLMRDVLAKHQLKLEDWELLADRYFRAARGNDPKAIAQDKINLSRQIAKDQITWKRFLQVMLILGYDEYELSITMKNKSMSEGRKHAVKFKNPIKRGGDRDV